MALRLIGKDMHLRLDPEEQRPGEYEVRAALRLLKRIVKEHPRAFDVVVADSLYADPRVFNLLIEHGKDALALMEGMSPERRERGGRVSLWWEIEGFTNWSTAGTRTASTGTSLGRCWFSCSWRWRAGTHLWRFAGGI